MTDCKLVPVHHEHIDDWWPVVLPFLRTYVGDSPRRYEPEYFRDILKKGKLQLWLVMRAHLVKAACMTEIIKFPLSQEMNIIMMTGEDVHLWLDLIDTLEHYARSFECGRMTGNARLGWYKKLKSKGYKRSHMQIEKDLLDVSEVSGSGAGDSSAS